VDRQQKIGRIANQDGVSKVDNLKVDPTHIDPDYEVEPCDGTLSETGNLKVLKLVPKSGNGPYFIARWDQRPQHLDIDMHGASKDEIRKFKGNRDGYSGHHTSRTTDPDKRIFDVTIKISGGVIFDGTVSFSNHYEVKLSVGCYAVATADATLIRAGPKKERS
jgi:hypothetical protein